MANRPAYEVQAQEWTTTSLLPKEGDDYYRREIFGRHEHFPGGPRDQKLTKLKHYRPTAAKPWVLVAFLCAVAACIAFLEYAAEVQHRSPSSSSIARRAYLDYGSGPDGPDEGFYDYPRRQVTGAAATSSAAASSTTLEIISAAASSTTVDIISAAASSTTVDIISAAASSTTVDIISAAASSTTLENSSAAASSTTVEIISAAASSTTLENSSAVASISTVISTVESSSAAASSSTAIVEGPEEPSELTITSEPTITSSTSELTIPSSTSPASSAAGTSTAAAPTSSVELTLTTAPTVAVVTDPTTTVSTAASGGSPSSGKTTPNDPSTNFSTKKKTSTTASGGSLSSSETTPNAPSTNFSPTKTTTLTSTSSSDIASSATSALTVLPGTSLADETIVTGTSTPTKATTIAAASGATTPDGWKLGLAQNFTGADYFLAMYLPTFLTLLLRSGWGIIFAAMKMMEPFYQLARRGGASAEESLLADYLSSGLSLGTLRAMWRGNWVLLLGGLVYLGSALVVTLAGESMRVSPTGYCHTHVSTHQPCNPVWVVNRPVVRVMETLLCATLVLVIALLLHTRKRFSGVFTDPSWISSMADLLGDPAFVEDLRNIPPFATADEVKAALAGNWYKLTSFEVPGGRLRYGVVKTEEGPPSSLPPSQTLAGYTAFPNLEYQHHHSPPRKSLQASVARFLDVGFFLAVVLALFSIILAYWFLRGDDPLNNFFNGDTFGPRFLLTGGAVVAGSGWKRFEREARIMEPYRRMADRQQLARAEDSVRVSLTGTPFSTAFVALARRSYAVAVIAAVTLLSQVLIIAVPGVPFGAGQIIPAYRASTFVSLAILGVMVLAFGVVVARRRGDPPIPRDPDTPVHVWLYLCASRMVDTSRGLEVVGNRVYPYGDRGDTAGVRCYYWCALSTGVDARRRWMVEEDRYHVPTTTKTDRRDTSYDNDACHERHAFHELKRHAFHELKGHAFHELNGHASHELMNEETSAQM